MIPIVGVILALLSSVLTMAASDSSSLLQTALDAVAKHPDSHIEMAMDFTCRASPDFHMKAADFDRLVKVGRSLENLVTYQKERGLDMESSLSLLVQECDLLASGKVRVPRVRFGKTEIQMPIVTLGCMRFQQAWGSKRNITRINQVDSDCQDNLMRILKRAVCDYGMVHIETARGYGCSELQLGVAIKHLLATTPNIKREDLIIQTKVGVKPTAAEFRAALETSFENLQVDYVDLFSFHGLNMDYQFKLLFDNGENGNCWDVIQEYKAAGKIRHVGFSTHGDQAIIRRFIETDVFDYVNLHYHFVGSYTTSGVGEYAGNRGNLKLLHEKDMGVFIISPYDKGGKLYEPSNKLRSLCLPDMEPMAYGSAWLWNHEALFGEPIHTIVVGAARPADLDQPAVAAHLHGTQREEFRSKVKVVMKRLKEAEEEALGKGWAETCYRGVVKSNVSKHSVEHNQLVWHHNVIKAFGMLEFAKDRYRSLEGNRRRWDKSLNTDENIKSLGIVSWGFVPGLSPEPDVDYSDDLEEVPPENKSKVLEAESFVRKWCGKKASNGDKGEGAEQTPVEDPPMEWKTAYKMKPWTDFPDRP